MKTRWLPSVAVCGLTLTASLALASSLAAPSTWVVDDDAGPGVDFTSLQAAIDAAAAGDLLLVRKGNYGDFDLDKELTILGEAGARTTNGSVHGIAGRAVLAELEFRDLAVADCSGSVLLDHLGGWDTGTQSRPSLFVDNSADVRLIEIDRAGSYPSGGAEEPWLLVRASRVEVVSSSLVGDPGNLAGSSGYGGEGGAALRVEAGGFLHVARTNLVGGEGGDHTQLGQYGLGGEGGDGLRVEDGQVLMTGRGAEISRGGKGGSIILYGYAGDGGDGIDVSSTGSVRYSNVRPVWGQGGGGVQGQGAGSKGAKVRVQPGGSAQVQALADPTLERLGEPLAGSTITLKLRSQPGAHSRLFFGFAPQVLASPGVLVDNLLLKQGTLPIGTIPANGVLVIPFDVDPLLTPGTVVYLQAMSIFPGGEIRRTNSVPIVVR